MSRTKPFRYPFQFPDPAENVAYVARHIASRMAKRAYDRLSQTPTPSGAVGMPFQSGTKRMMQIRPNLRKIGAVTSKSSGFVKTKKRVRRKTRKAKNYKSGITKTLESGNQVGDKFSVYLMHNSVPIMEILYVIGQALAKKLVERYFGIQITNVETLISDYSQGLIDCYLSYYSNPTATAASDQLVAGNVKTLTVKQFGEAIADNIRSVMFLNDRAIMWRIRMYWYNTDPPTLPGVTGTQRVVEINLRTLMVDIFCKSSLKFQNRSASVSGTEADEVDNVPLYGKMYECKGSGFNVSDRIRQSGGGAYHQFITRQKTGFTLARGEDESTGALKEPPQPNYFSNCTKFNKIRLEPGHIKTSVLVFKKVLPFSSLLNTISMFTTFNDAVQHNWGKSRLIGLEKIMETTTGSSDPAVPLSIGYETNLYINVNLNEKNGPTTAQLFEKF